MINLIINIGTLVVRNDSNESQPLTGKGFATLHCIHNAFLLIEDGKIADFGVMDCCPASSEKTIDANEGIVIPSWCDSHTHLVFAGSREGEFVDRINGLSYQEIAEKGGGILNSARKLSSTPEEILLEAAKKRLYEVIKLGTGAIEVKSGYGLSVEGEMKMLRVIRKLKEYSPIPIKTSFLGAHALPVAFKENRSKYIDLVIGMLPKIADEGLADYIDVFCEKVAFSPKETEKILQAGAKYNLRPKVHTNQFYSLGGIEVCVENKAISVDHLEVINDQEIAVLKNSSTIATLLPSAPFFLNDHYPPARKIIDANLPVALASDFNPGSSPSGNMSLVVSLACIKMKMTPEEAINAATINGAFAMELQNELGSISIGKTANLVIFKKIPSISFIPYSFGTNLIDKVIINGKFLD